MVPFQNANVAFKPSHQPLFEADFSWYGGWCDQTHFWSGRICQSMDGMKLFNFDYKWHFVSKIVTTHWKKKCSKVRTCYHVSTLWNQAAKFFLLQVKTILQNHREMGLLSLSNLAIYIKKAVLKLKKLFQRWDSIQNSI